MTLEDCNLPKEIVMEIQVVIIATNELCIYLVVEIVTEIYLTFLLHAQLVFTQNMELAFEDHETDSQSP